MHVYIYSKKDWMATVHLEMHRNSCRFIFGLLDDTVKDFYEKGPRPNKTVEILQQKSPKEQIIEMASKQSVHATGHRKIKPSDTFIKSGCYRK